MFIAVLSWFSSDKHSFLNDTNPIYLFLVMHEQCNNLIQKRHKYKLTKKRAIETLTIFCIKTLNYRSLLTTVINANNWQQQIPQPIKPINPNNNNKLRNTNHFFNAIILLVNCVSVSGWHFGSTETTKQEQQQRLTHQQLTQTHTCARARLERQSASVCLYRRCSRELILLFKWPICCDFLFSL